MKTIMIRLCVYLLLHYRSLLIFTPIEYSHEEYDQRGLTNL